MFLYCMKRRLIIFPGNFLPHIGGLETHVDEFAKYLSKDKDYEITIFSPDVVGAKEREVIHSRVSVIRYPAFEVVPNFPFPKFWSARFYRLFLGLYKNDYEIVMTRTRFFSNSTLGMFFAKFRFRRLRLVHVEHGSEFVVLNSRFKSFVAWVYDKSFGKLNFVLADKVVAISDAVYKFVKREFVRKRRVAVVRRGVDFEYVEKFDVSFDIRKRFKDKVVLCYIGRLYKWKGVENAIEAYKSLDSKLQNKSVFVIGGYGEDLERLKRVSGRLIDKSIFFLGKVPFGENYSIMKASDIHVHSSYPGGGLGSSLLQFMYCENAIVASPHEGADEVVVDKKHGVLLKDNSVEELRKGMEELISNGKLRREYARGAKKAIVENFSWERVIGEYKSVFDEVMRK
jgi:glycosyltransferase involved in cell wall biosynthesis